ncbi:hypothetical protein ACGFMK_13460 [Amycolatopsis sp. NPDC049252]|uniref:hypothetical protein n=1 Tax=Amycolatopsis sp. NPDC049252 TaxID=3363933 RepID=UPI003713F084
MPRNPCFVKFVIEIAAAVLAILVTLASSAVTNESGPKAAAQPPSSASPDGHGWID